MAGVAAIFYYTLIASYSAIEVMRDETIQTAEASSGFEPADRAMTNTVTWGEYQPPVSSKRPAVGLGKARLQTSKIVSGRFQSGTDILIPQITGRDHSLGRDEDENTPIIIKGGKRITIEEQRHAETSKPLLDMPASRDSDKNPIKEPSPSDGHQTPKTLLANIDDSPALTNQENMRGLHPQSDADRETAASSETETPLENLSVSLQKNENADIEKTKLATRAQEFAVALLPSFIAKPKIIKREPNIPEPDKSEITKKIRPNTDVPSVENTIPDDDFLSNRKTLKKGPILPVVSEAARIKKMLLAYSQEIDYIRATIIGLGISKDTLPEPLPFNNQASEQPTDEGLRTLMIKLAEHRAVLRKIPFKTPMLYFYISSGYGMRKHPKTGKKTFHHGIDLAGTWQENVRVTAPGKVISAGSEGTFGKVVRVQHEFGLTTTYAHLARITVRPGDYLSENHVVGKMGNTGRSAGSHLHYEIRVNGKSIDPDKFMKTGRQLSVAGELRQSSLIQ